MQSQKGQNLLEISIALGVAATIIAALTITTLKSLNNSQFSKSQVQATKLAQEGMEIVKTIRFRDYTVCIDVDNGSWGDIWDYNFGKLTDTAPPCTSPNKCKFVISKGVSCSYGTNTAYSLTPSTNSENIKLTSNAALNTIFKRQVYIEDYGVNCTAPTDSNCQKKITVEVSWTDLSGPHKSQISTIFAKY